MRDFKKLIMAMMKLVLFGFQKGGIMKENINILPVDYPKVDWEKEAKKMFDRTKSSKDIFPLDCPIIPVEKGDK